MDALDGPGSSPADLTSTQKTLMGMIAAAALADLVTTKQAEQRGAYEANPLMRNEAVRYPLKIAATTGSILAARKLWKDGHKTAGTVAALLGIGIPTAAAIWNSQQARK